MFNDQELDGFFESLERQEYLLEEIAAGVGGGGSAAGAGEGGGGGSGGAGGGKKSLIAGFAGGLAASATSELSGSLAELAKINLAQAPVTKQLVSALDSLKGTLSAATTVGNLASQAGRLGVRASEPLLRRRARLEIAAEKRAADEFRRGQRIVTEEGGGTLAERLGVAVGDFLYGPDGIPYAAPKRYSAQGEMSQKTKR